MTPQKEQNQSIDPNKVLIEKFYNSILSQFGLKIGTFTLGEIIEGIRQSGFIIKSLLGKSFPDGISFDAFLVTQENESRKRLLRSLLFESETEREHFEKIIEHVSDNLTIDKIKIIQIDGLPFISIMDKIGQTIVGVTVEKP